MKYPIFDKKDNVSIFVPNFTYVLTRLIVLMERLNTLLNNSVVIYGTGECSYSASYMRAFLIDFAYFSSRGSFYLKK